MKQIALLLFFAFASLRPAAEVTIRTEASFGAKKKDCLKGLGMCSARTTTSEAEVGIPVWLTLSDDESELTLGIQNAALAELNGQITNDLFTQDEDYRLPPEVSQALGVTGFLTIPAGSYAVRYAGGKALVRIPVSSGPVGLK